MIEKVRQQFFQPFAPLVTVGHGDFEHGEDVVLDRQAAKDRDFLRKIADAEPGAAIHGQLRHVAPVDADAAALGRDEARDRVKAGRLARTVRTEQRDDLAPHQIKAHVAQHQAALASSFAGCGRAGPALPSVSTRSGGRGHGVCAAGDENRLDTALHHALPGIQIDGQLVAGKRAGALRQQHVDRSSPPHPVSMV